MAVLVDRYSLLICPVALVSAPCFLGVVDEPEELMLRFGLIAPLLDREMNQGG